MVPSDVKGHVQHNDFKTDLKTYIVIIHCLYICVLCASLLYVCI